MAYSAGKLLAYRDAEWWKMRIIFVFSDIFCLELIVAAVCAEPKVCSAVRIIFVFQRKTWKGHVLPLIECCILVTPGCQC